MNKDKIYSTEIVDDIEEPKSSLEVEIVSLIDKALKERMIELGFEDIKVFCKLENGLISIKNCVYCITIMEGQN